MGLGLVLIFLIISFGALVFTTALNSVFFKKPLKRVFFFTFAGSFLYETAFLGVRFVDNDFFDSLARVLNYYLGFLLYAFLLGLLFWLFYIIFALLRAKKALQILKSKRTGYIFAAVFVLIVSIAIYNFEKPISIEEYTIESDKVSREYKIVQFNDIQYGSVTKRYMEDVVRLVYEQEPDFAVFVGDLIDFAHYDLEDFEVFKEGDIPVYFERGNHEFYHDPERILAYLKQTQPVRTLINQKDVFEEIEIVGIDHNSNYNQLRDRLAKIDLDRDKFSILIYHEPKGVEFAIAKGFDLMLFAHTHGGQIWPITELIDYMYKYGDGFFEVGDAKIYTSDGAALWGPKMRLDSQNEIVIFNIVPKRP